MIDPLSSWLHGRSEPHGPVILMYHSVQESRVMPDWPWALSLTSFCRQLDFLLDEGYETPSLGEYMATPEHFTGRTAIITFDDGYRDNLLAAEKLWKNGMKATFYVVSGAIGKEPHWPDTGRPSVRLLNVEELRMMTECGMEIGSHTVNHARLTEASDDVLLKELTDSRTQLEEILDTAVTTFAYPYGLWDSRCELAVKSAGYRSACLTRTGWGMRDNDPWRLRRLTVFNDCTLGYFARMLALASHEVGWSAIIRYFRHRPLRTIRG